MAQAEASGAFNGEQGEPGPAGPAGADGQPGEPGADGYTPIKGVDYFDGQPGKDGADGKDGEDYVLTNEDKQEIAEMAAELVDVPDSGGNVDLTGYATEKYVREYAQPKGDYLTEVPEGYAKTEDIPAKPEDIGAQPAGNYLTEVPSGYATEEFVKNKIAEAELGGEEVDLSGYAQKSELPTKISQLENDKGYLTSYTETDPTVPAWAKAENKPTYTKTEIGLGNVDNVKQYSASNPPPYPVTSINNKTGAVQLDAEAVGARPSTWMPTASDVGALPSTYTPPDQTAEQVGADPKGTADSAVSQHNTATDSHNDIRLALKEINDRLNAFFDSDDKTLDELSEIVEYITNNKTLIDSITTSKINVSDIVNNLTTNVSNKPLSAAQGVALKGLIDGVSSSLANYQPKGDYALRSEIPSVPVKSVNDKTGAVTLTASDVKARPDTWMPTAQQVGALPNTTVIPDSLSDLTADSAHRLVTDSEKASWNAKAEVSEIPTKVSQLTNDSKFLTSFTETDPTVPSWAKAASKPSYTKSEVGLGNVDNVRQYSANNPPVVVQSGVPTDTSVVWVDLDDNYIDDNAEVESFIINELAKRGQLKPEFAQTIAECTDTTKLYVLPDGYIYAYTNVSGKLYTNQLPISKDKDGNVYNGTGYKKGVRYSTSGKTEVKHNLAHLSGYIPVKAGDVVRLENVEMKKTEGDGNLCSVTFFSDYDVAYDTPSQVTNIPEAVWNDNDTLVQFTSTYNGYFRLTTRYIGSDSIVTVNEKIEEGTTLKWTNTGHAFIPADYEDRIIDVEEANAENEEHIEAHEIRIANLESGAANGIPDYVIAEAEEVIDKVIAAQGSRTFTFAAITDMHYGNASYTDGLIHACQAMQYIDSRIKLDAVSVLGDYTDGFTGTSYDNAIGDFKAINAELNSLRFAPNLRVHGNHDHYEPNSPILHRYITAYSDDVVWGSKLGGYFYRDFKDFKLRIICLNTAEENKDGLSCSVAQYNWFVDALDLSSKEDVAEWQTLILSHHPLDWFISVDGGYVLWQILNAYLNGTSWTNTQGTAISCNFAGKNSAKIVGNIHGHIHNLMVRNIAEGRPNGTADTINVVRVATPEACYGRPNGYNGLWDYNPFGEDTSYPKTQGTADDTAFCIYCIDLDAHTIKAICYGAGYDRDISY